MKGLCYSALSYAPLFIDKKVVVIGNDELALRAAGELATVARHVTLVTGNNDRLKTDLGKKLARSKNVTILENHSVVEVKGDTYARTVVTKDAAGVLQEIAADGTFVEMALTPNTQMLDGLVELDNRGRIIVDNAGKTSTPGIFAAGDVTNTYAEQVLVAIGEGAKAALSAYDYLLPTL
jgi:alkyl hydroperoxide reductase subunit AhpF